MHIIYLCISRMSESLILNNDIYNLLILVHKPLKFVLFKFFLIEFFIIKLYFNLNVQFYFLLHDYIT